jgi:ubiquinone/menaquinone biosynthesis C-methylase UbiE
VKADATETKLRTSFTTLAEDYDRTRFGTPALSYFNEMELRAIREMLGDVAGLRLLDVGSGTGRISIPLAAAGARVTAVDLTAEMTARAREKAAARGVATLRFCLGSARQLPLRPGSFDALTSVRLLHLIPRNLLRSFVEEMAGAVRPGGVMVLEVNSALYGGMLGFVRDVYNWRLARGRQGNRTYYLFPWEVRRLVRGLGDADVRGVYLPLLWRVHRVAPGLARWVESLGQVVPFKYLCQNLLVRVRTRGTRLR